MPLEVYQQRWNAMGEDKTNVKTIKPVSGTVYVDEPCLQPPWRRAGC